MPHSVQGSRSSERPSQTLLLIWWQVHGVITASPQMCPPQGSLCSRRQNEILPGQKCHMWFLFPQRKSSHCNRASNEFLLLLIFKITTLINKTLIKDSQQDDSCLQSQFSGGWGRRIARSSKSVSFRSTWIKNGTSQQQNRTESRAWRYAERLGALVFAEDGALILNTHMVVQNHP